MKKCGKCQKNKEFDYFYKNVFQKDGFCGYCKICHNEAKKTYADKHRQYGRNYYAKNKEKVLAKIAPKLNTQEHKLKRKIYIREYQIKNKKLMAFKTAKRRAVKKRATILGFDKEIKQIYLNCPDGYHVDHIIPLVHSKVCGLHVPWNLQHLPAEENLRKSNKIGELSCV